LTLTAPRIVRNDLAVRPCLPITFPTSVGSTLSRKTVPASFDVALTETCSGLSTNERAIAVINSTADGSAELSDMP
jgi:hypothetical protein